MFWVIGCVNTFPGEAGENSSCPAFPNYLVENVLVVALYNLLGISPVLSFLIAAVLGVPANFFLVKFFAFGKEVHGA